MPSLAPWNRRPNTFISAVASVAALGGNPPEVVALFERAVEVEPHHPGALFGLAMENDRAAMTKSPWISTNAPSLISPPTWGRCSISAFCTKTVSSTIGPAVLSADSRRAAQSWPGPAVPQRRQASGDMYYDEDASASATA